MALSLAVIVVYGGLVWYVFPTPAVQGENSISWEGHLAGLMTGLILSFIYKTPEYKKIIKYDWEHPDFDPSDDKFMQRFDTNGNFVDLPKLEVIDELEESSTYFTSVLKVNYEVVTNEKNESKPES